MKLKQTREQMSQTAVNGETSHQDISANVQQAYLSRLTDSARRLREIERDHIRKIGKLYGVEGEIRLPEVSQLDRQDVDDDDAVQDQELIEEIIKKDPAIAKIKKQEIESIVHQMNQLSDLFRDVSNLVVEQGTVLDRIDFHIQDARG